MKITFNKIFFSIFAFVWIGFILWNLATPSKAFSENENRYLADLPKFTYDKFVDGDFMNGIDAYIDDQFVIRDQWINMKTMMERGILKQDINSVYFAKGDYLIERYNDSDVSEEQAQRNKEYLIEFLEKYLTLLGEDRVKAMLVPSAYEVSALI